LTSQFYILTSSTIFGYQCHAKGASTSQKPLAAKSFDVFVGFVGDPSKREKETERGDQPKSKAVVGASSEGEGDRAAKKSRCIHRGRRKARTGGVGTR
jgi:hypothetical protein